MADRDIKPPLPQNPNAQWLYTPDAIPGSMAPEGDNYPVNYPRGEQFPKHLHKRGGKFLEVTDEAQLEKGLAAGWQLRPVLDSDPDPETAEDFGSQGPPPEDPDEDADLPASRTAHKNKKK